MLNNDPKYVPPGTSLTHFSQHGPTISNVSPLEAGGPILDNLVKCDLNFVPQGMRAGPIFDNLVKSNPNFVPPWD
jgi:hypothetical protein